MANKHKKKSTADNKRGVRNVAFVVAVLVLLCIAGLLYIINRNRRADFLKMRDEMSAMEVIQVLEPRIEEEDTTADAVKEETPVETQPVTEAPQELEAVPTEEGTEGIDEGTPTGTADTAAFAPVNRNSGATDGD